MEVGARVERDRNYRCSIAGRVPQAAVVGEMVRLRSRTGVAALGTQHARVHGRVGSMRHAGFDARDGCGQWMRGGKRLRGFVTQVGSPFAGNGHDFKLKSKKIHRVGLISRYY
ncbi:MAG: hypothetical protein ACREPF_05815 [Rhodanobacteraceae bacterium]